MLPETQILMVTVYADNEYVFEALKIGASGYLLKSADPAELTRSIHEVIKGGAPMSGQIARRLSGEPEGDDDAAGAETAEGRVQQKLTISKAATPLQEKLTVLADLISKVGYVAAVAIFIALLARGLYVGEVRFTPTFAVSRSVGWSAHVLEQVSNNRLIRPQSQFVGPTDKTFTPIESR